MLYKGKVAIFGDSITAQNSRYSANGANNEAEGYMTWFQYLSHECLSFNRNGSNAAPDGNFGVGGNTTAQMFGRIGDVLAYKPEFCIVHGGTNDCNAVSFSFARTVQNLAAIYRALGRAGIKVVAIPIIPRTTWANADYAKRAERVNQFIRNFNSVPGERFPIWVVDPTQYIADPTVTTGAAISGMLADDGIHPTPMGAYWMGKALYDALRPILPPSEMSYHLIGSGAYDAALNPKGNLLTNGLLLGTGGAGGFGDTADGWTIQRATGTPTTAASKGATAIGGAPGTYQQIDLSSAGGGTAADLVYFRQDVSNWAAGDRLFAMAQLEVVDNADAEYLVGNGLSIRQEGVTFEAKGLDRYDAARDMPAVSHKGLIRTPTVTVLDTTTTIRLRLEMMVDGTKTGSAKVRVGNIGVFKV